MAAAVVAAIIAIPVVRSGEPGAGTMEHRAGIAGILAATRHAGSETTTGSLSITIGGLRQSHGTILVGLYDSEASFDRAIELAGNEGFLNDPDRVAGAALRANDRLHAAVGFSNLPPGRYAVILFHDENSNGRLDKNFWGVPIEPYGFSNNAQGALGPPGFADAALTLDGSNRSIAIELVYHEGGIAAPLPDDDPAPSVAVRAALRSSALAAGDAAHF